ncbi:MAG: DNRLRE domain-containing protein [Phycisphaerales bacterium]|nr:DNRLRE domain-containing protein [Phycisphaerales bacterium]
MNHQVSLSLVLLTVGLASAATFAETSEILADRDTAIFGPISGDLSSGAGTALFVGRRTDPGNPAGANTLLRSLIRFDVSEIPAGAFVTSAKIRIQVIRRPQGAESHVPCSLHRSLSDWGESTSFSGGGGGAPAAEGDATWMYRFFPTEQWDTPGGDFVEEHSGSVDIIGTGPYTIEGVGLAEDVQAWIEGESNHGWMMIGDESMEKTACKLTSRENPAVTMLPKLIVEWGPKPALPSDINGDGIVNGADLGLLIGDWGPCGGCPGDLDQNGVVNGSDLGLLLASWGVVG